MFTITRSIFLFLMIGTSSVRGTEHEPNPFAADAPAADIPRNPNHLEPIPAYDPEGYDQAVFRSLIGESAGELWMVGKASFSPEYAVIIRHEIKYAKSASGEADPFNEKIESEKWVVEYVEVRKQIWRWKHLKDGSMELDIKVTRDVSRSRADVTSDFAGSMTSAWRSVLRQTRYPEEDYRGCDGATFQFYCHPDLFGEIWSPSNGRPLQLANLGHKLKELAKAEVKNRPPLILECIALAQELASTKTPEQGADGKPPGTPQPPR